MGEWLTLIELSHQYRAAAEPLCARLAELRAALKAANSPESVFRLKRRIAELKPMLAEMNALADLTERYYESGYYRDERFTTNGIKTHNTDGENRHETDQCNRKRAFADSTACNHGVCNKRKVFNRRCNGTRGKRVNSTEESERRIDDNSAFRSVLLDNPDGIDRLLSALDL